MTPRESIPGTASPPDQPSGEGRPDEAVVAFVADALSDATPRSATLALLRFEEYLGLLRRAGLDVAPSGALSVALRAGLSRVCRDDGRPARDRRTS